MQIDKETHKYADILYRPLYALSSVDRQIGKTNVLITLMESLHGIRFENVDVYSISLKQWKYRYLINMLALIMEIGYFHSNNSDVHSTKRGASEFHF